MMVIEGAFAADLDQDRQKNTGNRVFDVLFAGILGVVALPVVAAAAIAIKIEDGGPVFYRQERVGLGGKSFWILKLRSMRTDAEKNGPQWASSRDSRITRVGRLIRKTRIDELPQLVNVLQGDMAMIGPRPERPCFVEQLAKEIPNYDVRHQVKPGITGLAQVSYKYGSTADDAVIKHRYDMQYIDKRSLMLDLLIAIKTIKVVITGAGAQ